MNVRWGYSGDVGPDRWAELSPEFAACRGKSQSPVDVRGAVGADLEPLEIRYPGSTTGIVHTGGAVQVDAGPGSSIRIQGRTFELVQFHMHVPAEHTIEGRAFALETHFVHVGEDEQLTVVAVLFREGESNPGLRRIGEAAPRAEGERARLEVKVEELGLLPESRAYYRYMGSLTAPPCTEGVIWLILDEPLTASREDVDRFVRAVGRNARPVQPLNGRLILHREVS